MKKLLEFVKDESGQGMTEYILVVALIAIAVIIAVKFFGTRLSTIFKDKARVMQEETN